MTPAALPDDPASRAFRRFRAEGHPAAVTEVFDLVGGELHALAVHLTRGGGEAEDLVQETFLVALARARRFDEGRAVTPWLVGILVKEAARYRRRAARGTREHELQQGEPPEPVSAVLSGEVRVLVAKALADVPQRYREVLAPVLVDGVAPGTLAVQLGRAPGTVRAQLHRGLELLRRALPESLAPALVGAIAAELSSGRGLAAVRADVARAAALRGPAIALGATSTVLWPSLGALAVSMKTTLTLLAVAALGLATYFARSPEEAASPSAIDPVARVLAPLPTPPETHDDGGVAVARAEVPAITQAEAQAPPPADVATRVVLRGQLLGVRHVPPDGLALLVRAGVPARILETVPVSGDGPFVVDLTEHLAAATEGANRVDPRVSVILAGAGYAESGGWAAPTDSGRAQELTLAVTVTAKPILRTLRGHVLAEGVDELSRSNLVEFVADGVHREPTAVFPSTRVGVDGRFALELTDPSAGTLIVAGQGHGVLHVPVREDQLGDVDLGTLTVPRGARIAGRAVPRAGSFARGTYVLARADHAPASWTERALGLQAAGGRVHHAEVRATLASDGAFELVGLEPGLEYTLVVVPARIAGRATALPPDLAGGLAVTAPAEGLALEESLVAVHVVVQSGGAPVAGAELRAQIAEGDPRAEVPEALRGGAARVPRNGRAVVLLPPQGVTTLHISASNHEAVAYAVEPAALAADEEGLLGPVVVELAAPAAPAIVEWHLVGPLPAGASLGLRGVTGPGQMVFLGPVPLVAGSARFEGAPVGNWHALPILVLPSSVPFAELPFGLEHYAAQTVETRAGEVTSIESEVALGGRVELALLGRDPLAAAPAVLLVEADGNEVLPELVVPDGDGHRSVATIETDGPLALGRVMPAGEYTLRIRGDAYETSEQRVTVRPGEVTRVTADLVRRRQSENR